MGRVGKLFDEKLKNRGIILEKSYAYIVLSSHGPKSR